MVSEIIHFQVVNQWSLTPLIFIAQGAAIGAGAGFAGGFVASGGNIKAALTGAVAGAVTGGVVGFYGSDYGISRVFANGVANGVSARIQGGNFMDGLRSGLITSTFTYGNMLMRNKMIASSMLDGLDENGVRQSISRNDGNGFSIGMFMDGFKLAGGRFVDAINKGVCSVLGCDQNGPGKIFGISYSKGSFTDMVLESFAGPHDMANSSHFYNELGNGIDYSKDPLRYIREYSTNYSTSLLFASPFAAGAISEQSNYSAYRYLKK